MSVAIVDRSGWMQTASGKAFEPLNPNPDDIDIEDIAHSLALQCRFAGHCLFPYSVAQHSLVVVSACPREFAFVALMHDAAESFVVDMPRPIKHHPGMAHYIAAEAGVWRALCVKYGLPLVLPAEVKLADEIALATEKRDVMAPQPREWLPLPPPLPEKIQPWDWRRAKAAFLEAFEELKP